MIHEEICTYEVCKLAKEKGFPQDVFGTCEMKSACYLEDGKYCKDGCIYPIEDAYTAPTQSLLQRWLREEKEYAISVTAYPTLASLNKVCYAWEIKSSSDGAFMKSVDGEYTFSTYELALEDALKYALENLV